MILVAVWSISLRLVEVAIAPTYRSVSHQSTVVRAQLTDELLMLTDELLIVLQLTPGTLLQTVHSEQ